MTGSCISISISISIFIFSGLFLFGVVVEAKVDFFEDVKGFLADDVFDAAGVFGGGFFGDAESDEDVG